MKFSLILATLDRSKEIKECLNSLTVQEEQDFEIIVIDQSDNDKTKTIVERFNTLNIKYYAVDFKGLSKARNYGLQYAEGEYACLLDDDAIYTRNYLLQARKIIEKYDCIVLSGIILSIEDKKTPFVKYSCTQNESFLKDKDILNFCPSATLIFPIEAISKCGNFDERLGVGNKYASAEETDFLLRLYDQNYKIMFCNLMVAYHPIKLVTNLQSLYNHALGKGALFKIDFCKRKHLRLFEFALRNTIGMLVKALFANKVNRIIYLTRFRGFISGVIHFQ